MPIDSTAINKKVTEPELASNAVWNVSNDITALKIGKNRAYRYTNLNYVDKDDLEAAPIKINDITVIPLSLIKNIMGATVEINETKVKIISLRKKTIELTIGEKNIKVNSQTVQLSYVPFVNNGRIYIPLRQIIEAMGYIVYWDNRDVVLISPFQSVLDDLLKNDANIVKIIKQLS